MHERIWLLQRFFLVPFFLFFLLQTQPSYLKNQTHNERIENGWASYPDRRFHRLKNPSFYVFVQNKTRPQGIFFVFKIVKYLAGLGVSSSEVMLKQ